MAGTDDWMPGDLIPEDERRSAGNEEAGIIYRQGVCRYCSVVLWGVDPRRRECCGELACGRAYVREHRGRAERHSQIFEGGLFREQHGRSYEGPTEGLW